MLSRVIIDIPKGGAYYANWAYLLGQYVFGTNEIAIMGKNALNLNKEMQMNYLPTSLFMGGNEENLPLLEMKKVEG